ncbi:MFS general substrate transporter [Lichtheimia hyalospora FSU 10163]|nr:MFS general substrate transporter [Lichtheimia hyalospora FSU 10163]
MSRQSSSTTISDGRETSHTIIVSSEQTDDDEKHWAPAATKATDHDNGRIRTHPMAWIALFFLVVLRSAVSIFQNTFSPIPTVVADYLGVTLTEVNWLFNIQAVVYIALSFITGWLFERLGTKRSATVWFPENRRATAGMFIIMVAGICTGATIPQFLLPAKPPVPVSYDSQQKSGVNTPPSKSLFFQSTIALMKSVHFWILCGIHGINVGLSIAWGALLNQAITPYGYSDSQAGNMVAVAMAAGAVGALTAGPMLDSTKKHKLFLKLMAPFMCSTYVALIFIKKLLACSLKSRDSYTVVSHPIPESISTSILWQMAQLVGFILVLVLDVFRDPNGDPPNNMFRGLVFQAAMAAVSVVLSLIYNGPMLRTQAIKERENQRALESN